MTIGSFEPIPTNLIKRFVKFSVPNIHKRPFLIWVDHSKRSTIRISSRFVVTACSKRLAAGARRGEACSRPVWPSSYSPESLNSYRNRGALTALVAINGAYPGLRSRCSLQPGLSPYGLSALGNLRQFADSPHCHSDVALFFLVDFWSGTWIIRVNPRLLPSTVIDYGRWMRMR